MKDHFNPKEVFNNGPDEFKQVLKHRKFNNAPESGELTELDQQIRKFMDWKWEKRQEAYKAASEPIKPKAPKVCPACLK